MAKQPTIEVKVEVDPTALEDLRKELVTLDHYWMQVTEEVGQHKARLDDLESLNASWFPAQQANNERFTEVFTQLAIRREHTEAALQQANKRYFELEAKVEELRKALADADARVRPAANSSVPFYLEGHRDGVRAAKYAAKQNREQLWVDISYYGLNTLVILSALAFVAWAVFSLVPRP